MVIRYTAAGLVHDLPPKDFRGEIERVFEFVRDNIRYLQDINEVETLQFPVNTLEFGYGDCDDMAMLLASLLESIGHPSRFAALATQAPNEFDHVIVQTRLGENWISLDATEDYAMGWQPPSLTYLIRYV